MGGGARGGEATALVDGDIDHHRAGTHPSHQIGADQLGRGGARHQDGANYQIGLDYGFVDGIESGVDGAHPPGEQIVEEGQPGKRSIEHGHRRPHAQGDPSRVGADHPTADNGDHTGGHTGHTAQQHAGATLLLFQAMGADLDRHPSRHLGHRRQQRQAAFGIGHRLIGDGNTSRIRQRFGLARIGGEMEIGEQHLTGPQQAVFDRLRLLDLDHQIGDGKHFGGRADDLGTGCQIGGIGAANSLAGPGLDHDPMAAMNQFPHAGRNQTDAIFVGLDFFGYADPHGFVLIPKPR